MHVQKRLGGQSEKKFSTVTDPDNLRRSAGELEQGVHDPEAAERDQ